MAKLVLSSGGSMRQQFFIDRERLTIGRASENDVVIGDGMVSNVHAAILSVGNDHIVEDLQSRNGIFVNGVQLSRHILQHRDVIEFGAYSLCYLNSKSATEIDLDQTMLTASLPRKSAARTDGAAVATARPTKTSFPLASVRVIASPLLEGTLVLDRVVVTFGRPDEQMVVLTRRPHGYFIGHLSGTQRARVNLQPIGLDPQLLNDRDVIDVADEKLEFVLG